MKESDVQKQISGFLQLKGWIVFKHRNVGIYKQDTGKYIPRPYGEKGISDLIGCSPTGQFGVFEVKKTGGNPSPNSSNSWSVCVRRAVSASSHIPMDDVLQEL